MKTVQATCFVGHGMESYLQKVFDAYRIALKSYGFECSDDQDILDTIFEDAIRKECAKYGYKG